MKTALKKLQLMSLLIGMMIGSFVFVACGDDDESETTVSSVSASELIGTWYLLDEKISSKVAVDVIEIFDEENLSFHELKAYASENWQPRDAKTMNATYSYDGKRFSIDGTDMAGEITKENGKYMIQRYEKNRAVGSKTELKRVKDTQEAYQAFMRMVDAASGKSDGGSTAGSVSVDELVGCWYLIDENSSEKLCIDVIQFIDQQTLFFTELKAKARYNWIPQDEDQRQMQLNFTYNGKHIVFTGTDMAGDITKENGKYMIQRYEGSRTVGSKTELVKVKSVDEASQVFASMLAAKF